MKKIFTTLLILMLLFIFGVTFVVTRSLQPYNQARLETEELAMRRADLAEADEFYWYNGEETYFTVTGESSQGQPMVIIVQQDGGAVNAYRQDEIIPKSHIIQQTIERENPHRIMQARIGMENNQPIWEVSYKMDNGTIGYSLFSLTTGEWLRTTKNI